MRDDIVLEGAIPPGGIVELLTQIEQTCATGELHYESALEGKGTVTLVRGQFAEEQTPDRQQRDPVEVLLMLREGRYFLQQRLPPLPVSSGDHRVKSGSLAVHVPSALMRYCELAGLTGVLRLSRPPQSVDLVYERGELTEARVGGGDGIELQEVFGWEEGRFSIEAQCAETSVVAPPSTVFPTPEAAPSADRGSEREVRSTTQDLSGNTEASFLRVVEMSLEDLLRERIERTPSARTGPVIPELPPARVTQRPPARPLGSTSEPVRGESTVRVIYLAAERTPGDDERRPAMDLNVPLPGEGRAPSKPHLPSQAERGSKADPPRTTAISALDDAGRLRQSKWPEAQARASREDDITTQFDTASHAAKDLGHLPTMLAGAEEMDNDDPLADSPRKARPMTDPSTPPDDEESANTLKSPATSPVAGAGPARSGAAPAETLVTLKWVAFACVVLIACLTVLARLPPID